MNVLYKSYAVKVTSLKMNESEMDYRVAKSVINTIIKFKNKVQFYFDCIVTVKVQRVYGSFCGGYFHILNLVKNSTIFIEIVTIKSKYYQWNPQIRCTLMV